MRRLEKAILWSFDVSMVSAADVADLNRKTGLVAHCFLGLWELG
jgi:hypothetical protein